MVSRIKKTFFYLLGVWFVMSLTLPVRGGEHDHLMIPPSVTALEPSGDFLVRARTPEGDWRTVPVYAAKVAGQKHGVWLPVNTSFASFDFKGTVEVSITCKGDSVRKALVRPLSTGIKPVIKGNTVSFSLTDPHNLSVEIDGEIFKNLQLFANSPEYPAPSENAPGVLYFGAGIHNAGRVCLKSGQSVYLASGSLVRGSFLLDGVENVTIAGHGILDADNQAGLMIQWSKNISVDGPIILAGGIARMGDCDRVTVSNIKGFTSGAWGDGIDVFSSTNVLIRGCYFRTSDDCVAIYGHRGKFYGDVKNVTVSDCALWADVAHPLFVGTHGNPEQPEVIENLVFKNIDILDHCEEQLDYQGCMAVNAGDANMVRNVRFENIRVEKFRKGQLLNLRVMFNKKYNTVPGRGIENVLFKDISYDGDNSEPSVISGYDDARRISNVSFQNLRINGRVISDGMKGKPGHFKTGDMARILVGEHVRNLKFSADNREQEAFGTFDGTME